MDDEDVSEGPDDPEVEDDDDLDWMEEEEERIKADRLRQLAEKPPKKPVQETEAQRKRREIVEEKKWSINGGF